MNAEQRAEDLTGLDPVTAQEYVFQYTTGLKMTEKQRDRAKEEAEGWDRRALLAESRGAADLAGEARREAEKARAKAAALETEAGELRTSIDAMRRQLPGIAARERTVDPDLLEQELLMAAGRNPGDEAEAARDRAFEALEKTEAKTSAEAAAEQALAELKARMAKAWGKE